MTQEHLTEYEVQQYAMEQKADHEQAAHIAECAICSVAIANYRTMFTALSTLEKPVFNFDIEKQLMAELAVSTTRKKRFPYTAVGISALSVATVAIAIFKLRSYFTNMFSIPAPVLYLVATTALTIAIFQCRELITNYRQKMRLLNYY